MSWRWWFMAGLTTVFAVTTARAVILFGTGDPTVNTTPPTGPLAGSGWSTQTDDGACATAVGSRHLLTAAHIGLRTGDPIQFGGLTYRVTGTAHAPESDLQVLEVAGRIDPVRVAALQTQTNEVGRLVVLHGRGRQRGAPVFFDGPTGPELRGWLWDASGSRLRWGTNVLTDAPQSSEDQSGQFLSAVFSADAGADEATLSVGDSGGGVFLKDEDGTWKLAGVLYAVEAEFRRTADDDTLFAALFDRRGFFEANEASEWVPAPEAEAEPGTVWFATRVSVYRDWIEQETGRAPTTAWPRLLSAPTPDAAFTEHAAYTVDPDAHRISTRADSEQRFFRLEGENEIRSIQREGDRLELQY